jgi:hypothetical protein
MNAVFTICAKNYLAQALTLKESFEKKNKDDFFIFLADEATDDLLTQYPCIRPLNKEWCPKWQEMAFKYDVMEFSTSIKPFCFATLFKTYENVIYLDPDIFVFDNLGTIYEQLNHYSIILTPHFCEMELDYKSANGYDRSLLCDGIYNLGFVAIHRDETGLKIVQWWQNRLEYFCFHDHLKGLFTDQKWMIYIPALFPEKTLITHHLGMNTAVWNLHERNIINENGKFYIENNSKTKKDPLLFFHFSGFRPEYAQYLTHRRPEYNVNDFPVMRPMLDMYKDRLIFNGYEHLSKQTYAFNYFTDGTSINKLDRRLFRVYSEENCITDNPFDTNSKFYSILIKNHLTRKFKEKKQETKILIRKTTSPEKIKNSRLSWILRAVIRCIGVNRFIKFTGIAQKLSRLENYYFIFKK